MGPIMAAIYAAAAKQYHFPAEPFEPARCFPSSTKIQTSLTTLSSISALRIGSIVLALDASADQGRGTLVSRRVINVLRNTTTEWLRLIWEEAGLRKELVSTPGHHFLDRFGNFPTIAEMTKGGKATVVLASGELAEVTVERLVYSAETAHMFERAVAFVDTGDGTAAKPVELDCWQTYNIEVEDLHTYIAGGVRVHNDSGLLGRIGNAINDAIDGEHGLNVKDGGVIDKITDGVSALFHMAGEIVDIPRSIWSHIVNWREEVAEINADRAQRSAADKALFDAAMADDSLTDDQRIAVRNWYELHDGKDGTTHYQNSEDKAASEAEMNRGESNREKGTAPVLLDLNGNGIEVTALDKSTRFVVDENGLQHRTAWAGNGDGVLFIETDTVAGISNSHEYVFTEWDASADDDMAALRSAFDTNGDGKLTSADTRWGEFRVLVTNADGSTTVKTLTELCITEINLRADTTHVELPDGSVIDGQATFVMGGVTRTAANVSLMAEAMGARVEDSTPTYDANLTRTITSTGYDAAGEKLFVVKSVTTATGGTVTNFWDMNGDGVFERVQRIVTAVDGGTGARTETVEEWHGATIAGGVKDSRTVTVTSADGKQVTISRDHDWGGWLNATVGWYSRYGLPFRMWKHDDRQV